MRDAWFVLSIQPEPWRTPPHGIGRKGGKLFVTSGSDEQLVTYQEGVRDLMRALLPQKKIAELCADKSPVKLTFYYFRQLGKGIQPADATNLNKALEDALQGILYDNDRAVNDIRGVIVAQRVELAGDPKVIIHFEDGHDDPDGFSVNEYPEWVANELLTTYGEVEVEDDLSWPPTR